MPAKRLNPTIRAHPSNPILAREPWTRCRPSVSKWRWRSCFFRIDKIFLSSSELLLNLGMKRAIFSANLRVHLNTDSFASRRCREGTGILFPWPEGMTFDDLFINGLDLFSKTWPRHFFDWLSLDLANQPLKTLQNVNCFERFQYLFNGSLSICWRSLPSTIDFDTLITADTQSYFRWSKTSGGWTAARPPG